jgi:ribose transport system permease protein
MDSTETTSDRSSPAPAKRFHGFAGRYGLVILLVLLIATFSVLRPESFATWQNYRSILDNQTVIVLLAMATMVPLIVGQFDLSVAATLSLSQTLALGLASLHGWPVAMSLGAAVFAGAAIGLVNGIVVVRLKVSAFIATLASATIIGGLGVWFTGGEVIFGDVPDAILNINARVSGFPLSVVYVTVVAAILWVALNRHTIGRRMYAVGSNPRAATMTGVPTNTYVIGAFMVSGVLAAVAGILLGARLGSAQPSSGDALLLPAYAGAFLGATAIKPGRFNVVGTVVSVYAVAVAVSGLQQVGAPVWFISVFQGAILIAAVALSGYAHRARLNRARKIQLARLRGEVPDVAIMHGERVDSMVASP